MSDQLRDRLNEEMALEPRPAMDGLVEAVVVRGAGVRRRRRRMASGAGTTVVVATVAAVVALGGVGSPDHAGSASGAAGSAQTAAPVAKAPTVAQPAAAARPAAAVRPATQLVAPVTTTADPAAAASALAASTTAERTAQVKALMTKIMVDLRSGSSDIMADKQRLLQLNMGVAGPVTAASALPPGVPATPTGMLELLTSQLTAGSTSHAGVADDGSKGVEVYVSTPTGPAMVRVFLDRQTYVPAGCGGQTGCTVEPDGDVVVVGGIPGNCIETNFVTVTHPDGSEVMVTLSTCLEWDGTQNAPSPSAMTINQATALASDSRWDVSMDPALVSAGAAHFPSPIQFG